VEVSQHFILIDRVPRIAQPAALNNTGDGWTGWHYLGYVVELWYYPHYFSMLLPTFCFSNLYWQFLASFSSLNSYQTATRSINSHVKRKILTLLYLG